MCDLDGTFGFLLFKGVPGNATTVVGVPGGGQYQLVYQLHNGGGPPNSWRAIVESVDGSFAPIVLDPLLDVLPFNATARQVPFSLPFRALGAIRLTFQSQNVSAFRLPLRACLA